ncbi:MAG: MarR family transcriptional regulator [Steroidobacteraceae bacterium]
MTAKTDFSFKASDQAMLDAPDATDALTDFALEGPAPYLVRRLQQIVTSIFADEMLAFGITAPQYATLSVIVASPNLDQEATAFIAGVERTTVVGVVNRLVKKGLVKRTVSKEDKRVRLLQPTRAGVLFVHRARVNVDRIGKRLLAPLSKSEKEVFCETLRRILREPLAQESRMINVERLRLQPDPVLRKILRFTNNRARKHPRTG